MLLNGRWKSAGAEPRRKTASLIVLPLLITVGFTLGIFGLSPPPVVQDSSSVIQITHGVANRIDIIPSPNGRYIVYSSNQSGAFSIWLSTITGTQLTRVTEMSGEQILPQWSPLGDTISFVWRHDSYWDLCLARLNFNSWSQRCITVDKHVQDYAWNANGQILAFDDMVERDIHLYYLASGISTLFEFNGSAMDPAFGVKPNVLYFSVSTGHLSYIWNASIDGKNSEQLSWIGSDTMPQVSPAGDQVMFLSNVTGRLEPWLIDLKTGVDRYLFDRPNLQSSYTFPPCPKLASGTIPQWNSNGSQLLMISGDNETYGRLFLVTLDFPVPSEDIPTPFITAGMTYYFNIFNPIPTDGAVSYVRWIPNGKGIALVAQSPAQILIIESGPRIPISYGG